MSLADPIFGKLQDFYAKLADMETELALLRKVAEAADLLLQPVALSAEWKIAWRELQAALLAWREAKK